MSTVEENALVTITRECDEANARMTGRLQFFQRLTAVLAATVVALVLVVGAGAWFYFRQAQRIDEASRAARETASLSAKQKCRVLASADAQLGQLHWRQAITNVVIAANTQDLAGQAQAVRMAQAANAEEQAGNDALRRC